MKDRNKQDRYHEAMAKEYDCEEYNEINEDEEILSDMINQMGDELLSELAELPETECPCCLIKEYLLTLYNLGREDGIKSLANAVANSMMDIIEE